MNNGFFQHPPGSVPPSGGGAVFVAVIPAGISESATLLRELAERLRFPEWFGGNWNALADGLRDLSWIPEQTVVLWHEELPRLPAAELKLYRELLADSAASWKAGDGHRLEVWFPETQESSESSPLRRAKRRKRT